MAAGRTSPGGLQTVVRARSVASGLESGEETPREGSNGLRRSSGSLGSGSTKKGGSMGPYRDRGRMEAVYR